MYYCLKRARLLLINSELKLNHYLRTFVVCFDCRVLFTGVKKDKE